MNKTKRSQREFDSKYTDFIQKVNNYHWEAWEDDKLVFLLRESAQYENRIAEAYSIIKEIIRRKTGLTLFDTQLMAAYSMQQGHIAELPTGEGKTLAAVVTATILALQGKPVQILVFNDYLAQRDYNTGLPIYKACGLTCGYIIEKSDFSHRKSAYSYDVVYVSAKEAAFDYIRDFLCTEKEQLLLNPFSIALVDEADSILIDEARIPLVLAGNADIQPSMAKHISKAVSELTKNDYESNPADNQVWLTESGIKSMESKMKLGNLYNTDNADVLTMINAALQARILLKKDKDFIVKSNSILVIDESTGRVADNRRFPDLLHQAVEMQELGVQDIPSVIYNSISMQAFLLQYNMLCGMTGTAKSSEKEFRGMYELDVDEIPPHIPCIRIDHPDFIFFNKEEQEHAILSCIQSAHSKGQPVLIGTQSVQESEHFSALLTQLGLNHSVLNARNDEDEGSIIAEAGKPYQITISTNMAGRGVDIRLGGSNEKQADFVRSVGGLYVIGTGINRSIRIDNQLRGRSGRQGDPGESRFFICVEDLTSETFYEFEYYNYKKYPKLLRRAQKIQEGKDAENRYMLEKYTQILEEQRKNITDYRTLILLDLKSPEIMQNEKPSLNKELVERSGLHGVSITEKQLTLYFINVNWADYLAAMEDKRSGIHLMLIGNRSPLDEYKIFAVSAFNEMIENIKHDVIEYMLKCRITENGIDMEQAGLSGATTTWTYMINESASQFNRIPHLVKSMSTAVKGTLFTVKGILAKIRKNHQKRQ